MPTFPTLVLLITTTTTALIAGLLFAYSCSVNPGLHVLPDLAYLSAMQSINRAILNPAFLLCFLGAAVLLVSAWFQYRPSLSLRFWLLVAAAGLYLVGVLGVTTAGNVPLNESLAAIDLNAASPSELATHRAAFEPDWNRWHMVRTLASIASLLLLIGSCLTPTDTGS